MFYNVATHGGITAAARRMTYGIQQPAISGQLLQLEKELGLRLFERRPFALTAAGHELFDFVAPFFGQIADTAQRLRDGRDTTLRLAAPATVLHRYLPELLQKHERVVPRLTLKLRDANQADGEELLQKHEIDLAISELEGKPAQGLKSTVLLKLPIALLLPAKLKISSAAELLRQPARHRLISLPATEVLVKKFHAELRRLRINWSTSLEVSSLDLVATYVSLGLGVGLSIALPGAQLPAGVRSFPLPRFPPLIIAAIWRDDLSPANTLFLGAIKKRAEQLQRQLRPRSTVR
ncbi:MAG: LysR family transcriptional regulator [Chthoniobacterales bacterium]